MNALQREFNGQKGAGLVPDWCAIDGEGRLVPLEDKNDGFGYEALRVPLRIGLNAADS